MTEKQTPMVRSNEAVARLNQVTGFDPIKLLQKAAGKSGAEVARLSLRYKKLWFRLVCPKGRIRINALQITDELARIEAAVYLHKDDPNPVANFTAERTVQDTPQFVQAAQYEAQDNALTDAGFGIQLCDICGAVGEEAYMPNPAPTTQEQQNKSPVEHPAVEQAAQIEQPAESSPAPKAEEPSPEEPPATQSSIGQDVTTQAGQTVHEAPSTQLEAPDASPAPISEPAQENPAGGSYTPDMTVEDICARMTLEEARAYVADVGMCKGQTLGQVADKRPASLRWYIRGCKDASNVLKAASQVVLDSLAQPKAA